MDTQDQNGNSSKSASQENEPIPFHKVAMPLLQQTGKVFVGPGAQKEAQLIGLGLAKLSSRQKEDLDRAKRYAMDQSIKHVLLKQQISHQQQQQKVAMYGQALSLMARVYIGSISFEIREEQIRQHFSVFGPVKSINMSWDTVTGHHKGFAFLEFEVPEAALLAQEAMNGKLVGGRNLKVGRPANMPQAQPIIEMVMQEAKQYNRVYVASVHPDLSEQDLKSVFDAFGEIVKCQLAKQPGKNHRGFGYLEFKTAQAVKEAIEGMNNFDLGGQHLQVGRCITPPDALTYVMPSAQSALPTASAVAAAAVTAKIQAREATAGSSASPRASSPASVSPPVETARSPKLEFNNSAGSPASPRDSSTNGSRKRGFGGFAAAVVAPSVVQPAVLPPGVVDIKPVIPSPGMVDIKPVIPPPGVVDIKPVIPPPGMVDIKPVIPSSGMVDIKPLVVAPPPPPEPTPPQAPPAKKEKKDLISRIKIKSTAPDPTQRATFAPLPDLIAPKDPSQIDEENGSNGDYLAIEGPKGGHSSNALALLDSRKDLAKIDKNSSKSGSSESSFKKKKKIKAPKEKGPKLNTPQALAAAEKAGAINDQMQAVQSANDEATLASQENVEIRGNDARHLLMHKLMRTNRSSVILLKNMVTADGIDDELDEEIRSELEKYGTVVDLLFVREDESSNDVRVFARFGETTQAEAARKALDKRFFDGRNIIAESYDQALFEHGDYTG